MPLELKPVYSSHIDRIGYDLVAQELHVEYSGGGTFVYDGVPPEVARNVMGAPSIGEAMHRHIRGAFPHRRLA